MFLSTGTEFSRPNSADDEWLFCVLVYQSWRLGGDLGLALLRAALITALAAVLYRTCRHQGLGTYPALAWAGGMIWLMRSRFMLRPQLVTDLMLAILVLALLDLEAGGGSSRRRRLAPWAAVPFFMLWANMQAGVIAGLGLITLWTLGTLIERRDELQALALATALSWVGALLTPVNVHMFAVVYTDMVAARRSQSLIVEWDPLGLRDLVGPFGVWVLLYGTALAEAVRTRAHVRRMIVATAFALLAIRHNRMVGELAATSAVIALPLLEAWARRAQARSVSFLAAFPSWLAGGAVIAACAIFLANDLRPPDRFDLRPPPSLYPIRAAAFLREHPVKGAIFNSYHFGGFLTWAGFSPFIHGMNSTYQETLFDHYLDILGDAQKRPALLDRFDIAACVLAWPEGHDTTYAFIDWLSHNPDWHLVEWDDSGLLFVRGTPPEKPYTALAPALDDPIVGDIDRARSEVGRALREAPGMTAARLLEAEVAFRAHDLPGALALCDALVHDHPEDAKVWLKRGVVRYAMRDVSGAIDDLRRAVALNPRSVMARYDLALACAVAAGAQEREAPRLVDEAEAQLRKALELDPTFRPAAELLARLRR
jgi:hypothetical protein